MSDAPQPRQWKYARTYPDAPHWYVLQSQEPQVFDYYREKIEKEGVRELFSLRGKTRSYTYFYAGEFKYWRIGSILNRARCAAR
jgi:hypothetical protein